MWSLLIPKYVVFAYTEICGLCLHRNIASLPTVTLSCAQAYTVLYILNATSFGKINFPFCYSLLKRFSGAIVCFSYFKGSIWRDSEWFDMADGSFGFESFVSEINASIQSWPRQSVPVTIAVCWQQHLLPTPSVSLTFMTTCFGHVNRLHFQYDSCRMCTSGTVHWRISSPWNRIYPEKLMVSQMLKKFPLLGGAECSYPWTQQLTTFLYHEPN